MEPVTLRTERLVLSIPTPADIDAIFEACQDAAIQRYTTVPVPYERHHAEAFVAMTATWWRDETEATWAIRHDGVLSGMIGLHHLRKGDSAEIGYWMAPGARGRGLITEAARAVVDWGFSPEGLDLVRIEWRAVAGNTASARLARRVGFRYEGLLRGSLVSPTGRDDGWVAGRLKDDDPTPVPWPVLDDAASEAETSVAAS